MLKFFRLFRSQYVGFWVLGLALFALQEVPDMIMPFLHLENNPIMNMQESSNVLNMAEKILGSLCIATMIFVVSDKTTIWKTTDKRTIFLWCVIGVLLLNYFGWTLYFMGLQSKFVMMFFIVMLPPLFYVFVGLWRDNLLLAVLGCVFEVVHFTHVLGNLTLK